MGNDKLLNGDLVIKVNKTYISWSILLMYRPITDSTG